MFTSLKSIFQTKKSKEERIKDAVDRAYEIIGNCEKEELRLRNSIATEDDNLAKLEDDSEEASRSKERRETCVRRLDEIKDYVHVLIQEIAHLELHHISRQFAQALKQTDNAKY